VEEEEEKEGIARLLTIKRSEQGRGAVCVFVCVCVCVCACV
jgi:hypothetical protein